MHPPRRAKGLFVAVTLAGCLIFVGWDATPLALQAARAGTGTATCETGWLDPIEAPDLSLYDIHSPSAGSAVTVGAARRPTGARHFATRWWNGATWRTVLGADTGADSVLVGVGGSLPGRVWAVGFSKRSSGADRPLAVRWVDGAWVTKSPPASTTGSEVLSAVDVDPTGGVWAVGTHFSTRPTRTALVVRGTSGGWQRHTALGAGQGTSLSAVLALAPDDVWAVGSRTGSAGTRPLLLHWDGTTWSARTFSGSGKESTLSGLAGTPGGDVWAVGWRRAADGFRPLVLRHSADGWASMPPPDFGGAFSVLTDVSLDGQGRPWVVGGVYRDATDRYVPTGARLDDGGWTVWPRPPGTGRYFDGVSGSLANGGFASGTAHTGSFHIGACEPPSGAGVLRRRSNTDTTDRRSGRSRPVLHDAGADRAPRPVRGLPHVPPIVVPDVGIAAIRARDVTEEVGLTSSTWTHGATVADLDGDGRQDLFISGHGAPPSLWMRIAGGYERQPNGQFRRVDRHDCDIGRIDAGPLTDIVCSVGGARGMGLKANEIWLDPSTGTASEAGPARGIADPVGRGREIALFDADGDADLDLFLGNVGVRYDGQASPNKLMLNAGDGTFRWDPVSGLTSDRGAWCALPRDMDRDGDQDLLLCGVSGAASDTGRFVLYRNDGGRFVDVTGRLGIGVIGERDAEMADLGGSLRPDLIQLSKNRVRVSLWSVDRFVTVFERSLIRAKSVAVGDVNGDGARDIYLQLGGYSVNDPDIVLLNGGTGRSWSAIEVPSVATGVPDDVVALDHDGNGLTDFLVLNGATGPGPLQLIAFYR